MMTDVGHLAGEPEIAEFQQNGVLLIRGAFPDWVDTLRAGVEKNIASPSDIARIYHNEDGGGLFFGDYCNWNAFDEYRDFVLNSNAGALAAALTRSKTMRLFHEHVLVKEPGTDVATPWHQDEPYYCVRGRQTCSLWLALDPVGEQTCAEFIAGSHHWNRLFRPERFNRTPLNENDGLQAVPDIEANRESYDIKHWEMVPGDVIAFDFRTVHGAPANRSSSLRRRAFSTRWIGDDCRYAKRDGVTSPPFSEVVLNDGDIMDLPQFPLVVGG